MTRKIAKSADQTSLRTPGTTETPGVLRSPPVAYREPRRLLSSTPFQSSSGECRLIAQREENLSGALRETRLFLSAPTAK